MHNERSHHKNVTNDGKTKESDNGSEDSEDFVTQATDRAFDRHGRSWRLQNIEFDRRLEGGGNVLSTSL